MSPWSSLPTDMAKKNGSRYYSLFICEYVPRTEFVREKSKQLHTFVCCNNCEVKKEKEEENMNGVLMEEGQEIKINCLNEK